MTCVVLLAAPEKQLLIEQSRTALERVNITCRANGVFPEPKMLLFREDIISGDRLVKAFVVCTFSKRVDNSQQSIIVSVLQV